MVDIPESWDLVRDLEEGGQGFTYLVKRKNRTDETLYVLKRLKNVKREEYFEREIKSCLNLDHPNVLKIVEHGRTPKSRRYLISPFCEGGSLAQLRPFSRPAEGLRLFRQICDGVAFAHDSSIFHLDLKPENIFMKGEVPVVGDFGICYIDDGEYTMTLEGQRGSKYYCAPELRNPKIASNISLATSDVYSLGKILYWIFTHEVRDGHQEEYGEVEDHKLANLFQQEPAFAFVDEIIDGTIQRNPNERIRLGFSTAVNLRDRVQAIINRIDSGGRVLDVTKSLRCLFCGAGTYDPIVALPPLEQRVANVAHAKSGLFDTDIYANMRNAAQRVGALGAATGVGSPAPLILVCNNCGNLQQFRFDVQRDAALKWNP